MLGKRIILIVIVLVGLSLAVGQAVSAGTDAMGCPRPGWFPVAFGLKDHHVFWYNGYYYLVSIYLPGESQFAYARSTDFCTWEELAPVFAAERNPGEWDEMDVWAPFVFQEEGTYYLYYTGVNTVFTQSIMLATSTDPADPASWQRQGMIFQPDHPDMVWGGVNTWSDCRDPTMIKIDETYYLYYTGLDQAGGIIGMATASSPFGPWYDWGAVLILPNGMPESSTLVIYQGSYYLFYNDAFLGEYFRVGSGLNGPWTQAYGFTPGWAHKIWQDQDGSWYTSYLTDYSVTISRLVWDDLFTPPHPFIGENVYHLMLPLILR